MTTQTRTPRRPLLLAALAALAAPVAAATPAPPVPAAAVPAAAAGPAITGFRDASFGMTQEQVRRAVEAEFRLPARAVTAGTNAIQHTGILTAAIPDLIPGGGVADVSYIFGYQSHRLMQVSVVWSARSDPKMTPQLLYQNGESLRRYFAGEGFPAQRSAAGILTPGGVLLFRATDPAANAVLLILSGAMSKDPKAPGKTMLAPTALTLLYAADPRHPDVFQLDKGSF